MRAFLEGGEPDRAEKTRGFACVVIRQGFFGSDFRPRRWRLHRARTDNHRAHADANWGRSQPDLRGLDQRGGKRCPRPRRIDIPKVAMVLECATVTGAVRGAFLAGSRAGSRARVAVRRGMMLQFVACVWQLIALL